MNKLRIDKQLEKNDRQCKALKRFENLFWAFKSQDYENPVTRQSIYDALVSIRKELV